MSGPAIDAASLSVESGWVKVIESGEGKLTEHLLDGRHHLLADEPTGAGGNDRGPGPYELLLMALGACTTMTLRLYADRKRWPLARVSVELRHDRTHAEDCADCETKQGMVARIERVISLEGALDSAQRQRLLEIADMCPVHRTLTSEIKIETRVAGAGVSP